GNFTLIFSFGKQQATIFRTTFLCSLSSLLPGQVSEQLIFPSAVIEPQPGQFFTNFCLSSSQKYILVCKLKHKIMSTRPISCHKRDLVVRTYRRLGQPNQKKAITQPEIAKIIEAFLVELQASLLAGEVITLRNHFSLEVETSPPQKKFNPLQLDQTIIRPELRKEMIQAASLSEIEKIYRLLHQQPVYQKNQEALDAIYHKRLAALGNKEE
ncbi:20899_t:CDS:2, partial [Racocetra persica]